MGPIKKETQAIAESKDGGAESLETYDKSRSVYC